MKSASHTRTTGSTEPRQPDKRPWTVESGDPPRVGESFPPGSASAVGSFDIESFGLVRRFVEHVVAKNASAPFGNDGSAGHAVDWGAVEVSIAGSRTLEQAIGRAVVIADQMSRGLCDGSQPGDPSSSLKVEDPFFAFSMADVVPDFGDGSRYRTRVTRKVSRIFGARRAAATNTGHERLTGIL
jgi:hypothetical protein